VGYIGSIEFWLDMEPLIKAIAEVHRQGIPVKFLLIGKHLQTGYPRKIENWIRKYGIKKITTWLNFVPHEEVPKYIAAINIGTTPFDVKNPTAYYAAPNKLWEYLSQGITVMATPIPEIVAHSRTITNIRIVRHQKDYIVSIKGATTSRNDGLQRSEIERILLSRTWSRSAECLSEILKNILALRS